MACVVPECEAGADLSFNELDIDSTCSFCADFSFVPGVTHKRAHLVLMSEMYSIAGCQGNMYEADWRTA